MSDKPAYIHHVNFPTTDPERTIECDDADQCPKDRNPIFFTSQPTPLRQAAFRSFARPSPLTNLGAGVTVHPVTLTAALADALGDVRTRATDRLAYAHDASHFVLTPQAVVVPLTVPASNV